MIPQYRVIELQCILGRPHICCGILPRDKVCFFISTHPVLLVRGPATLAQYQRPSRRLVRLPIVFLRTQIDGLDNFKAVPEDLLLNNMDEVCRNDVKRPGGFGASSLGGSMPGSFVFYL